MKLYSDIDENILLRYLQLAYYETLEKKYAEKKYTTYREYEILPNVRADFVAKKDNDEIIIYEIKIGKITNENKKRLSSIKEYVERNSKNVKFKMIFLKYPQSKEIDFDELQEIICEDLSNDGIPSDLDILSTHTRIEDISDIEVENLEIRDKKIFLEGNGIIEVSLQFGSDSESQEDDMFCSSFPFEFKVTLDINFSVIESEYYFDTDSYYE